MTPLRRHLFALLGLVLPVATFAAAPAKQQTASTHKAKTTRHASVHKANHRTTKPATPKDKSTAS